MKDFNVCWYFSCCFLYLFLIFIIILCNTLLPKDRVDEIPADIGKIIRPLTVIGRVIEVEVASMITIVSTGTSIVFRAL